MKELNYILIEETQKNKLMSNLVTNIKNKGIIQKQGFRYKLVNKLNFDGILLIHKNILRLFIFLAYFINFIEIEQILWIMGKKYSFNKIINYIKVNIYLYNLSKLLFMVCFNLLYFMKTNLYKLIFILKKINLSLENIKKC